MKGVTVVPGRDNIRIVYMGKQKLFTIRQLATGLWAGPDGVTGKQSEVIRQYFESKGVRE